MKDVKDNLTMKMTTKITTKKYLLIGIGIFAAITLLAVASFASGIGSIDFTGFFKAFDATLSPGEDYERNITVRMYYNATVRFRKGNSTTYLKFDDSESVIVLKDAVGNEIIRMHGIENGYSYDLMNNSALAAIATVSAYNISGYEDVVDQVPVLSTVGTKAYVTVSLEEAPMPASISGYIIDDLTGAFVGEVRVLAFENDANPENTTAVTEGTSDNNGEYLLTFELDSSKALDVYAEGYYVV